MNALNEHSTPLGLTQRLDVNHVAYSQDSKPGECRIVRPMFLAYHLNELNNSNSPEDRISQQIVNQRVHLYFRFVVSRPIHDIILQLKPPLPGQTEYANIIHTFDQHLKTFLIWCSTNNEIQLQQSSFDSIEHFSYWSALKAVSTITFDCHVPSYYCNSIRSMHRFARKFRDYISMVDCRWTETPRSYAFTLHECSVMDTTVYQENSKFGLPNTYTAKQSGVFPREFAYATQAETEYAKERYQPDRKYFPHFLSTLDKARRIVDIDRITLNPQLLKVNSVISVYGTVLPTNSSDLTTLKSYDIPLTAQEVCDAIRERNVSCSFNSSQSTVRSMNKLLWETLKPPVEESNSQSISASPVAFSTQVDNENK
jgi:hypothetical protein